VNTCTVCRSKKNKQIDKLLVDRTAIRDIAGQFRVLLDLQEPPPADAYAITGNYLPPLQQEWKRGNNDAIYILLTSLFHEITHTQQGADESAAY